MTTTPHPKTPETTDAQAAVATGRAGTRGRQRVASAMNDTTREVDSAIGIALMGSIHGSHYRGSLPLLSANSPPRPPSPYATPRPSASMSPTGSATGCRSPSNWPPPGCARSPSNRRRTGWKTPSRCSPEAAGPPGRTSARCAR